MQFAAATVVGILALGAFTAARQQVNGPAMPEALGGQVQFRSFPLTPVSDGKPPRTIRDVNPGYAGIRGWISTVGAAAALGDLDVDGRPNDICLVDPRYDTVTILPAPTSGSRFVPFALTPPNESYKAGTTAPMGCLFGDFNENGVTDVLVYYWGRSPVIFLRDGAKPLASSAFAAQELVSGAPTWFTNAALQADFDGDGHVDLLFGNYFPDDTAVLDATAVNKPTMQDSMSRAFNGGGLHLFLWKDATPAGPVYANASYAIPIVRTGNLLERDFPRFGWTLALAAADLNGDLRPEIYVGNDFGPDQFLLNRTQSSGSPQFETATGSRDMLTPRSKVVGKDSYKGMGVDFGSVTGDGRAAIAVSNISAPYALIEGHFLFVQTADAGWTPGRAPFRDEGMARGIALSDWAWDIKFADIANSGCPAILQAIGFLKGETNRWPELQEIAMGNDVLLSHPSNWPNFKAGDDLSGHGHDRVYMQDCSRSAKDSGRFHDISASLDLGAPQSKDPAENGTVSRGVATGDVFGDGRLSVVIARQWMPSVFLCNTTADAGRSITLDVRARGRQGGDRPLIGATARIVRADGSVVSNAIDGGSGHSGKRAPEIHLGLGSGPADESFAVKLQWRDNDGAHQEVLQLRPGRYNYIPGEQGRPALASGGGEKSCV